MVEVSSQRPPGPPSPPPAGGAGDDPGVTSAARTLRLAPHRREASSAGSGDGGPQSIADGDVVDAPDPSDRSDPSDDVQPRSVTRAEPTRVNAPAPVTLRGSPFVDVVSTPGSLPPAEDDDADSTARRHLAEDDALPESERAFGAFTLLRRLAFGGMGEVFLARRDVQLPAGLGPAPARLVVVKRILSHMRRDEKQRRGFVEEARLQTLLHSPHIVQIHDVGEVDGQVYLAMEHVHGPSWRSLVDRCRRNKQHMPLAFIVEMMIQAADGLSYAHNLVDANSGAPLRIVHRDINPHNVLVTYDGGVKIIDFGIAKSDLSFQHTETGTIKGKFAYMSPEQSAAEPLDARSDLFALGICFYELVTLTNPFKRGNVVLSLDAIQRTTPPPPSKSRPGAAILDPIIERMLRKNPDDRFADCSEVAEALRLMLQDGLIPEPQQPLSPWLRGLFSAEIANHRRILDETGSVIDAVVSSPRLQRPATSSGPRLPRAERGAERGAAPANDASLDFEPLVATAPEAESFARAASDAARTGPTSALQLPQKKRTPALAAAAVVAFVACAVVGAWYALPPGNFVLSARFDETPAADAGTAAAVVDAGAGTAAVVDAGAVTAAVVDAGAVTAAVVDAGAVTAAVVDAGVVDAAGAVPEPRPRPRLQQPATDVVARLAVSADGFVVKGPRTLGSQTPTLLVVDDRQAPFKVRLRVRADRAGGARIAIDTDPWAIVRVDQVGRGRTPVADVAVAAGKKTLFSLQNPTGAAMDISLTVTPSK
jgi:serine/threonine protein kinase